MTAPACIPSDFFVGLVMSRFVAATTDWLQSLPHHEEPLLHRLCAHLGEDASGEFFAPGGLLVRIDVRQYFLHRRGPSASDAFGSDLGYTVDVNGGTFVKTALFQIKRARSGRYGVEKKQLLAARQRPDLFDRSFALAVDVATGAGTVTSLADLYAYWARGDRRRKGAVASTSMGLDLPTWLRHWLTCHVGPPSDAASPLGVERLLERHAVASPGGRKDIAIVDERRRDVPVVEDPGLPSVWIAASISVEET